MPTPPRKRPGPKPKHGEAMTGASRQRTHMDRQRRRSELANQALGELRTRLAAIVAALGDGNVVQARAKAELAIQHIDFTMADIEGRDIVTDELVKLLTLSAWKVGVSSDSREETALPAPQTTTDRLAGLKKLKIGE
jgi:MoxR-like ATPase